MDRLTGLTVFTRVVENGSFSAAARRLSMSVTMASNHMRALEDRLGARLLNRTTRRVSLTEVGKAYYERCRQILAELEEADGAAAALQSAPRGTLRLFTSTNIVRFISPLVAEFLALYPEARIELSLGERMVDLVEEGFDLAIRTTPITDSSMIVRRLAGWQHILCCAPAYLERHAPPTRLADLARHNCLRYSYYPYGDDWHFIAPDGTPASVRVSGNLLTHSGNTLLYMALRGQGLFLAPSFIAADDIKAGRLVRLLADHQPLHFDISALYPHRNYVATKVRRFIDLVAERFREHQQWLDPQAAG